MMYVALSYDHRIIDGREAVTFLVRIKECVEDPAAPAVRYVTRRRMHNRPPIPQSRRKPGSTCRPVRAVGPVGSRLSPGLSDVTGEHHGRALRHRRDRRRAGRLCRGDPRRPARHAHGLHRQARAASAAPASISAASRRRRCCNPRRNSPRRGTRWPSTASRSARSSSISRAMMARKDKVVGDADPRRRVPVPQEQGRLAQGQRPASPRPGRVALDARRRRPGDRGRRDRHRDRLGEHPAAGHRDRRAAHRLLDRRAGARPRAGAARGDRRRLYRARTRLGLGAARRQGHGHRISRPHPARHGPRTRPGIAARPGALRHRVQARHQGRRRRDRQRGGTLELEPAAGGETRNSGRRCRAGGDRPAAVYRGARPRRDRRRARPRRAGSRSTTTSRRTSPASTRSAT